MAEKYKDTEGITLFKLAKLYVTMNEFEKAASCFEEDIRRRENEHNEGKEKFEACLFLARYHFSNKNAALAAKYAQALMETHGPEREEAKDIIEKLKNM
jgi:anaphase-promoting complex subunit 8